MVEANGDGIDSNKDLIINGGILYVIGSSLGGDSALDADNNFIINGGKIIALGSDMLQIPHISSTQKYLGLTLSSSISKNSLIAIKDETGDKIFEFTADENFKTLLVSSSEIQSGTYQLYVNDVATEYSVVVN